jgi:hypothetical protein
MRGLQPGHLMAAERRRCLAGRGSTVLENEVGRPFDSAQMSQLRGKISANQDFGIPHVARPRGFTHSSNSET